MELKEKIVLKDKGDVANLPTVKQLLVTLTWASSVDLDLMAFYEKKDGTKGGVYTKNLGGSQGDLNKFPFINLSDDAGVGAKSGAKEETMKIVKLDEIAKLYLVALNYTDAKNKNAEASFSTYDGKVTIMDEAGKAFEVPLAATEKGTVAHLCTIDNSSPIGATLKREDKVMTFAAFVESIPGANALVS